MIGLDELILLDTNVLVHLLRGDDLGRRVEEDCEVWRRPLKPLISVVSVGEIYAIARRNKHGLGKWKRLAKLIDDLAVVDVGQDIAMRFAEIQTTQQTIGRPIGEDDTWIAATAVQSNATLLTADRDFERLAAGLVKVEIIGRDAP